MLNQQEQFWQLVKASQRPALVLEKNWSGDALAAGLALRYRLQELGKQADIFIDGEEKNDRFAWLPDWPQIKTDLPPSREFIIKLDLTNAALEKINYQLTDKELNFIITPRQGFFTAADIAGRASGWPYDLIITVGSPDLESLGQIYSLAPDFFNQTPIINLDCDSANENYGQLNLVEIKAAAVCELVFTLLSEQSAKLDEPTATCLLAGIIDRTANFKTPAVSAQTLSAVAELMKLGARREAIIDELYRKRRLVILKLWGEAIAKLSSGLNNRLFWTTLDYEQLKTAGARRADLTTMVEELMANIPAAEIVVLFIDKGPETSVLLYALKNYSALELLTGLAAAPQGQKKIAQLALNEPLIAASERVIKLLRKKLITNA